MSDLISREDAIDACCRGWNNTAEDCIRNIKELPSAELPKGELISRADAIGIIEDYIGKDYMTPMSRLYSARSELSALPSAELTLQTPQTYGKSINPSNAEVVADLISRADIQYHTQLEPMGNGQYSNVEVAYKDDIDALPLAEADCSTCKHKDKDWDSEECDSCCGNNSHYESADAGWIPCNKQMPDELEAVNVTWVNHNPPPYYKYTEDVPLVDSAVYYRGKWYWWDATVIDVLAEYGEESGVEPIDKDIEVVAWMPLPTPYKEESEE